MDELIPVIEQIGRLNDSAEADRWLVAQHIAAAYAEFEAYHAGLTAGLCQRLRRSSDSIYGYRNAENLRSKLKIAPILSVSHFVTLHELVTRYELSDDDCRDWISRAVDDSLSVRDLRSEVALEHELDIRAHWLRKVSRVVKLMNRIYQDAGAVGMSESLYQKTKTATVVISDWAVSVGEWG